ncbi:MAG: ABC transporter substrate-binding protein [Eubacteriales bacterium]|nr:ABC transporter substrate-binding protein [Eubacteriales bacterium]
MKKFLSLLLSVCSLVMLLSVCAFADTAEREFTDSLGRTVLLPEKVEKIALSGPLTQIYVFPLCPELLVGFSTAFSEDAEKYIPDEYLKLPELGQLYGGKGTMNLEALLEADPDVVLDLGEAKDGMAEDLDRLTEQTGIPFIHINITVSTAPEAYRILGELIGDSDKAGQLADWCEKTFERVTEIMEKIDADGARKSVVYCLGPKGLNVLANGSFHAEIVSMVAENAAVVDTVVPHGDGNETDMEQLILWEPDVLIFQHNSVFDKIAGDETWEQLRAVREGEYYKIPCGPYGWISSPPAVQCYLGMLWLTDILYPEYVDYDLKAEVTDYYKLFYGFDMTDADYSELIG